MKIEKEYDVQKLANKVKEEIEKCGKCGAILVGIDFITAQRIVDVLETVASLENKRTESSDIMKRMLKPVCFGSHINGNRECNLCIHEKECMIETEGKKNTEELEELDDFI